MHASEARAISGEPGCAAHGQPDCLCDVPLLPAVQIRAVPFPDRLLQLGLNRVAFTAWAAEVAAWTDSQGLRLVAEA